MDNDVEIPSGSESEDSKESLIENDVKFDPSDYLPRRTSRASAHAASEAIKKSMKEAKTAPNDIKSTSETDKAQQKESSDAKKKNSGKAGKKRPSSSSTTSDCFVKLVRCEEDPKLKKWMDRIKRRKTSQQPSFVVEYGPTSHKHDPFSFVNGTALPRKHLIKGSSGVGLPKTLLPARGSSVGASNPVQPMKVTSLNVVVVHPKPGSKIVNPMSNRVNSTTSKRLEELLTDPNTVINSNVSRVMTTGGNAELHCDKCTKTYMAVRDLVNHKRIAHKVFEHICISCAEEFETGEELRKHFCKARYPCDICGVFCRSPAGVLQHKHKSHDKTLGSYMCQVCCFNASSQQELNAHVCGGKPKIKYSARESSAVLVYPPSDPKPKAGGSAPKPNVYVNLPTMMVPSGGGGDEDPAGSSQEPSTSSSPKQFLCEECLSMYPSSEALATHKCDSTVVVEDRDSGHKPSQPPVPALPKGLPIPAMLRGAVPAMPRGPVPAMPRGPGPAMPKGPGTAMPRGPGPAMPRGPGPAMPRGLTMPGMPPLPHLPSTSQPLLPLGMDLSEVEQLAKFYSSVVFKE